MHFSDKLLPGRLIRRYKRFLADVLLDDGRTVLAHCPNPGAMLGLAEPGMRVWLLPVSGKNRKLAFAWSLVEIEGPEGAGLVGIDTQLPNRLTDEALAEGRLPEFAGFDRIRREVVFGSRSRADFLLEGDGRGRLWLEVKNCHLSRTRGLAEFPDCTAARAAKHLRELEAQVLQGDRAALLIVVQREDCHAFSACYDIDPVFASGLDHAAAAGVEVHVYGCEVRLGGVRIGGPMPWRRDPDRASGVTVPR